MAEMTLQMPDGSSRSITVDDKIKTMAPADQLAFANHARDQISAQAQQTPAAAQSAAPASIPAGPGAPNNGYANDIGSGLSSLEHSARATARLADVLPDGTPGKQTVSDFGHGAQVLPQPANYQSAGGRFTDALREGRYGDAASALPHAAVQALPGMAPAIAAGAVGGPVAAAGMITAQNAGENVESRQANDGGGTPTLGNVAAGVGTAALQGGIGAFGLNPSRLPGVGSAISKMNPIARGAIDIGSETAAGAANSVVGQAGTTAGTTAGLHVDPAEVAGAAIQQGAARGATVVPGLAKAGVRELSDNVQSRMGEQPATLQDAQAVGAARTMLESARSQAEATKGDTSDLAAANSAKSEVRSNLLDNISKLRDSELISAVEARQLKTVVTDQAGRSNNTIAEGQPGGFSTLFDAVNKLNLPDGAIQPLTDGIRVLDVLSTQSFQKNQVGPLQRLGGILGNAGSMVGAAASMDPHAMMAAAMGHGLAGKVVGGIGGMADRALGLATPSVLLRARAADRMMKAAGVDESPSPVSALQDASAAIDDVTPIRDQQQRLTKLAEIHAAMADRLAVGNPARDPVPVNTPLPATALGGPKHYDPVTPAEAEGLPPVAPQPAAAHGLVGTHTDGPGDTPQAKVVDPQRAETKAPLVASQGPLNGWRKYADNGRGHTEDAIHAALDAAAADGHYTPQQAAAMRAHPGGLEAAQIAPVQRYLGSNRVGLPGEGFTGLPGDVGPNPRGPIVDKQRWDEAKGQYQTHADLKTVMAKGDPDIEAAIANIRHEPHTADKAAIRAELLATLPASRLDLAKRLLSGPLMKGV